MRDEYDDDDGGVPKEAENFWIIPPANSRPLRLHHHVARATYSRYFTLSTPQWIGRAHSWVHTTPQPWMLSGPVKRRGSEPWESCQTLDSYSSIPYLELHRIRKA
jgi:hypothetical protein